MTTPDQTPVRHRRGMLLLLVLSVLTLFVMVGAVSLVLATRARTAARAFAAASTAAVREEVRARAALDEALMQLLRGSATGGGPISESMLADRYGQSVTGSLSNLTVINSGSTLRASLAGVSAPTPLALNGRVLTIRPPDGDPAPISSFRITDFTSGTVFLANLRTVAPFRPLPTRFPCTAIINGRDFDATAGNEPYDRPDNDNRFLIRPAYGPPGQSCEVDNDGDGTAEGIWLSGVLPSQTKADGGSVSFLVSYAVYELDGRFNVNAHGTPSGAPALTGTVGPADVDGTTAFPGGGWTRLMATGSISVPNPSPPSAQQRRPTPVIGYDVNGRFGNLSGTSGISPYARELRLDFDGRRLGSPSVMAVGPSGLVWGGTSSSIFTAAELERLLRPFDADASALPPRLAAILGDDAQSARMLVTTDSWDTTGLVGASGTAIMNRSAANELPPDVIQGRRFDVNSGDMTTAAGKEAYFHQLLGVVLAAGAPSGTSTAQWVANVVELRDPDRTVSTGTLTTKTNYAGISVPVSSISGTGAELTYGPLSGTTSRLTSIGELLCVPQGSPQQFADPNLDPEERKALSRSLAVDHPVILDAVTIDSPFTDTINANPWREPGRVNVNTTPPTVWQAVLGEGAGNPYTASARSAGTILTDGFIFSDAEKPYTAVRTGRANRLANIATTRSNVFAVWVTVKIMDSDPAVPETYRRLFAIVDRSIPVGYQPGVNLNARDALRLVRYLE